MRKRLGSVGFFGLILCAQSLISAQTPVLPAPNKDGWIKLFRGNNFSDWYIANNGDKPPAQSKLTFPNGTYSAMGDTLKVTGNPSGQIFFNHAFSHYRIRYQMRFPGNTGNCGMLLHVQENDPTAGGFPRSLEAQGDPNQGMGQVWSIGDIWINIRAKVKNGTMTYDPSSPEIPYGAKDWDTRVVAGISGWAKPEYAKMAEKTGWVTQESEVRGKDSITSYVNDSVVIHYRLPRLSLGGTPNNVTRQIESGLIGWQSEGAQVWYREIEIKLLPGDPLYASTYIEPQVRNTIRPLLVSKKIDLNAGILTLTLNGSKGLRVFNTQGRQ
ncbi:MAG: DUF1080 domain-containing protein [Fibrobacterota bacterium]|nr:DUF1080 domain-containing protein [Fibrobacterota bacterium]